MSDGKRCEDVCKHAPPQKDKWPCDDCDMRYHDRAERKTNADRIRAMTDEELADWLVMVEQRIIEVNPMLERPALYADWLEWLKEEAEHG